MRRLLLVLVALCLASPAFADGIVIKRVSTGGAAVCGGSDTFFGNDNAADQLHADPNDSVGNNTATLTCPSTGTKRVCTLRVWAKSWGGTPGNIRVAIYGTDNALLCQGSAEKLVSSTTAGWISWPYTEITPLGGSAGDACNITGATNYRLMATWDSGDVTIYRSAVTAASAYYAADYTAGFPNPYPAGTATSYLYDIQAGVQ